MLLLDNFVHSDLHPGNIMIKFHRNKPKPGPSWIPSFFAKEDVSAAGSDQPGSGDAVVNELRALAHDHDAWRARLAQAKAEGYQPEIVFVDAGLVTTLNAVNRKNFKIGRAHV